MPTRDEVIYAYRMLLGRDPENEAVIERYAAEAASVAELRRTFLASPEFRTNASQFLARTGTRAHLPGRPMQVELAANPEQLQQLFAHVLAQWCALGESEPFWSVITRETYRAEQVAPHIDTFYASGEDELGQFDNALLRAGIALTGSATCLEFGCGVGRVTLPLAQRFPAVTGVDVSAGHLALARERAGQLGVSNIHWWQLNALDELARAGRFDAVYSQLVLQHNPPPVMIRLLEDLLWLLKPGGVAYFQIPTYRAGYRFSIDEFLDEDHPNPMDMHFLPQPALLDVVARCRCSVLEIREDSAIGDLALSISNTVLVQKLG